LNISGGNNIDLPSHIQAGAGVTVTGAGTLGTPYVVAATPKYAGANSLGACSSVGFKAGLQTVGDVVFLSGVTTIANPSAVLPATGMWTAEFHSINAITYPGSVYTISAQVEINGGGWSNLSDMALSNQAGAVAVNSVGSGFSSSMRSFTLVAGAIATIQTRIILSYKGSLTVSDELTSLCYSNNAVVFNHD
jgi:hypothetical protein